MHETKGRTPRHNRRGDPIKTHRNLQWRTASTARACCRPLHRALSSTALQTSKESLGSPSPSPSRKSGVAAAAAGQHLLGRRWPTSPAQRASTTLTAAARLLRPGHHHPENAAAPAKTAAPTRRRWCGLWRPWMRTSARRTCESAAPAGTWICGTGHRRVAFSCTRAA